MNISALAAQELAKRPSKAANHAAESRVLVALAQALAASPSTILDKLSQAALSACRAHSAGFSLLTEDGGSFYWASIAGLWACHVGGGTPRDFGPCGMVLDHDRPMLFWHPETEFPYLAEATPSIDEGLLLPFYVNGKAVGTIWVISHDSSVRFDAEDLRVMTSLATFASAAYQAQKNSERHFQRMLDALPAAVYTTDASGKITHYNRAAVEMSGRTPCIGADQWCVSWKLYQPDGTPMPHDSCPMARSLKQGCDIRGAEILLERPDGTRVPAMPFPTLLRDGEGRISGAINMIVDIRERKAAELALKASEERLRALIETTPECVKLVARDGTLLQMNASGLAMVGARSAQEVVGRSIYELIAPEHRQSFIAFNEEVCTGRAGSLSFDLVSLDGARRHMETHAVPFKGSGGELVHLAVTRDVTERRRTEVEREQIATQLREREVWLSGQGEALEAALNGAPLETSLGALARAVADLLGPEVRAAFYLANPEGTALHHVVGMAPGYAQAVDGFPIGPESLSCGLAVHTGQPILTSDVREEPLWAAWRWLAEKFDFRGCWSIPIHASARKFTGTLAIYWREPHAATPRELDIITRASQAAGIIVSRHIEMQMRQRTEDALRCSEAQLKEADRRKNEFLATLSHELRNPLGPIRNAAQLLRLKGPDAPELRWSRDVIERQLDYLSRLVDDLLDVSRITTNKIELRKQRIELAEVVNGAVESSRALIAQCGHELAVTLPARPVHLDADAVRLAQVFLNLLNNAAKYTERGGHIRLAAERQGDEVVVSVKDTGVGIPADKLAYVFEMFFQADPSLEKSRGGLGIGLSLVRQLVHLHGGTVEARSDGAGKGSEFIVRLPAASEIAKPEMPVARGEEATGPARRIVIVDDNRDAADSLAMLLEHAGHEVHTAYDGVSGVETVERLRPDVVLFDLGMPRLNGYDACRRIRAQPWCDGTMLIALTGWGQEHDRSRSREAGFDAHLVKPVDLSGLSQIISSGARVSQDELVP